jgi:hypothetical protein
MIEMHFLLDRKKQIVKVTRICNHYVKADTITAIN